MARRNKLVRRGRGGGAVTTDAAAVNVRRRRSASVGDCRQIPWHVGMRGWFGSRHVGAAGSSPRRKRDGGFGPAGLVGVAVTVDRRLASQLLPQRRETPDLEQSKEEKNIYFSKSACSVAFALWEKWKLSTPGCCVPEEPGGLAFIACGTSNLARFIKHRTKLIGFSCRICTLSTFLSFRSRSLLSPPLLASIGLKTTKVLA